MRPVLEVSSGAVARSVMAAGMGAWQGGRVLRDLAAPVHPARTPVPGVSMVLAGIHAVEGIVWLSLLVVVMHRIGAAMRRPAVRAGAAHRRGADQVRRAGGSGTCLT
jgi:hypothetical protein